MKDYELEEYIFSLIKYADDLEELIDNHRIKLEESTLSEEEWRAFDNELSRINSQMTLLRDLLALM